jgi:hypothetical protein
MSQDLLTLELAGIVIILKCKHSLELLPLRYNSLSNSYPMSYPFPTIETEFEWRPTNTNYGRVSLCSEFWFFSANNQIPPVPWSHGRKEVPLWLANYGVPLKSRQD